MSNHHSRGIRAPSYTMLITDALGYPSKDPLRLLALAVILRWTKDGAADEMGEEWLEAAVLDARCSGVTLGAA
jgi:hypothetical protein